MTDALGELTRTDDDRLPWSAPLLPWPARCLQPMGWVECEICGPDDVWCDLVAGHAGCHEAYNTHDGAWYLPDDAT